MFQTTHILLEQKDCIFLVNYLGIQFTTELVSYVSSLTRLYRLALPTVTSVTRKNMKSTTQKVSSLYFVASFKYLFGDDDRGYSLTPTYTMGIFFAMMGSADQNCKPDALII